MTQEKFYTLPELPYGYSALKPYISEEQLKIHHQKHHQAYVNGCNAIFEKLDKARKENSDLDIKAVSKELSFHMGGYLLHNLFWKVLKPASEVLSPAKGEAENKPAGGLAEAIDDGFGNFERFKKEFTQVALSVEGSGWAGLTFCSGTKRLLPMQIEKHNINVFPGHKILLVLDVWEHAYYLDYKNDRAKFINSFWNIVNWEEVGKRFAAMVK